MLASDFQNPGNRHDVNADRQVSPIDALLVINQLNATGSRPLSSHSDAEGESTFAGYIDTNGDESLSPIDALLVINVLADFAVNAASDEATPVVAASQSLGAVLGVSGGEVSLQATFDGDLPNVDEIGIYVVDQLDAQPDGGSPAWREVAELPSRQPLWQRGSSRNLTAAPSFPAGQSIGVYVVQATGDASPASDHLQVTRQLDGSWVVGWEDSLSVWPATNLGTGRGFDDWRMTLTVADSNLPPEFQSEPITTANAAIPYVYDSEATDPDADPLAYKLMSGPTGMMVDEATGLIRWTPTPADIGFHQIAIEVSDGALTDLQTYDLQIGETPSNRPPVITSDPERLAYLGTIEETGALAPVALNSWSTIQYEFNIFQDAEWVVADDGNSVRQLHNSDASIFLSDFELTDTRIEGTWLLDGGDDDMMGFVFGYQDTGHFYLFDWKKNSQSVQGTQNLGNAERGMTVRVVSVDDRLQPRDVWPTAGNGARSRTIFHNNIAWSHNVEYRFELEFHPGEFTITVSDGDTVIESVTLQDDTYTSGGFGFYNFSQDNAVYRGFSAQTVPDSRYIYDVEASDADGDALTYEFVEHPMGMTIGASTGLITWEPTEEFIGNQNVTVRVTDGRGGEAIQEYVLCVHPDPNN
ncbi:MAG: hypothetical protein KDA59_03225, partial [Planctomycetales bacterium]|nr:hypothetical protein [Planctomycetales bacterium]